jgi:hypothetical protein
MTDQDRGGAPASAVSTCGNAKGLPEEAAECYRDALPLLDLDHYWTPTVWRVCVGARVTRPW